MVQFSDYMKAIFSDIADAAGRGGGIDTLRTAALKPEREKEQYAKLRRLKRFGDGPLQLVNSRFVGRFGDGDTIYLCVQTDHVHGEASDALESALQGYGANRTIMDESTFLFLAYHFRPYYRVKASLLQRDAAENVMAVAWTTGYAGHEIDDVVNYFEDVSIFTVSRDSVYAGCSEWFIASHIASATPIFRTELIPQHLAQNFRSLQELGTVNPESIYYALTSIHWKQAFLEIYKCIEAIYYLPWVLNLKKKYGYTEAGLAISRQLRDELAWRARGRESIEALFELLDETVVKDSELNRTRPFADLDFSNLTASAIGRRINKIRNWLVHGVDYYDPSPIEISIECWPVIVQYVLSVTTILYREHDRDVGFSYLLGTLVDGPSATVS